MTRDSMLWTLGLISGIVAALTALPPPTEWDYYGWLGGVGALTAVVSAKLGNSPLRGKHD